MFARFWFIWTVIGLVVAVWVFWWAIKTRQFSEGRRAALLPFDEGGPRKNSPEAERPGGWGVVAVFGLLGLAILVTIIMLIVAFWPNRPI